MTLPAPGGAVQDPATQQNLEEIRKQFPVGPANMATGQFLALASAGTARKVAWGSGTVTFTDSATSAVSTITHGLGATPLVVLATLDITAYNTVVSTGNYGATTFDARGRYTPGGLAPGVNTFYWIAIG